ncbi:hypothetical protein B0H13DRAFT_6543 [Mycena leptocephala]|nr:hypothetical protein B0H13DRAFT_6543 [Mycena leptocephala]
MVSMLFLFSTHCCALWDDKSVLLPNERNQPLVDTKLTKQLSELFFCPLPSLHNSLLTHPICRTKTSGGVMVASICEYVSPPSLSDENKFIHSLSFHPYLLSKPLPFR